MISTVIKKKIMESTFQYIILHLMIMKSYEITTECNVDI